MNEICICGTKRTKEKHGYIIAGVWVCGHICLEVEKAALNKWE